uniref:Uncharacterized protein n=1 Tax=Trypanosoma congolense (strain IL3000) TaxID=1068625 RepID=G0UX44_TRYCI|nr:conserved hypothetical protein [Trypanosoma congolense IL3000]
MHTEGRCVAGSSIGYPRGLIERCVFSGKSNIWPMHPDVQQAVQMGRHLNMKAVVRGMNRVGKSTIVSRLCGYIPSAHYVPSTEMSAGTFFYRSRNVASSLRDCNGAKVELWDVVDVGISRGGDDKVVDARCVDVYRGCHVVFFVIDRTRRESLDYVMREVYHVPPTTFIVLVLNFQDTPKDTHVVCEREVGELCRTLRRATTPMILTACAGQEPPEGFSVEAIYANISATTGFGMDLLFDAFEAPYRLLKVLTLEGEINGHFQHMERHHAALYSELKKNRLLRKEGECTSSGRNDGDTESAAHNSMDVTHLSLETQNETLSLVHATMHRSDRPSGEDEVDENGIAKNFFDDVEDDDTCEEVSDGGDVWLHQRNPRIYGTREKRGSCMSKTDDAGGWVGCTP